MSFEPFPNYIVPSQNTSSSIITRFYKLGDCPQTVNITTEHELHSRREQILGIDNCFFFQAQTKLISFLCLFKKIYWGTNWSKIFGTNAHIVFVRLQLEQKGYVETSDFYMKIFSYFFATRWHFLRLKLGQTISLLNMRSKERRKLEISMAGSQI